mmetsp:Transcript_23658/g.55994  ORF Transcript_23658/g.55994 Transcript_23658/m.55994 type:complete len:174 (-) Transcript_23658:53-574(-)
MRPSSTLALGLTLSSTTFDLSSPASDYGVLDRPLTVDMDIRTFLDATINEDEPNRQDEDENDDDGDYFAAFNESLPTAFQVYAEKPIDNRRTKKSTMVGEIELPTELAELVLSVEAEAGGDRFYATYGGDDEMCGSKPASSFEVWEESFVSRAECCSEMFSYDLETCLGTGRI